MKEILGRKNGGERDTCFEVAERSRNEIRKIVQINLNETEVLTALRSRGMGLAHLVGWSNDIQGRGMGSRYFYASLENVPSCDVALLIAEWFEQNEINDYYSNFGDYMRGLSRYLKMARTCGLYDSESAEDRLSVMCIVKTVQNHLPELRSLERSSALVYGINSLERDNEVVQFLLDILVEGTKSPLLSERSAAWTAIAKLYTLDQFEVVVEKYFTQTTRMDSLLINQVVDGLYQAMRANRIIGVFDDVISCDQVSAANLQSLLNIFCVFEKQRNVLMERGHWEILIKSIEDTFGSGNWIATRYSPGILKDVRMLESKRNDGDVRKVQEGDLAGELVKIAWGRYNYLSSIFDRMATEDQQEVFEYLDDRIDETDSDILDTLFKSEESNKVKRYLVLTERNKIRKGVLKCVKSPTILKIISCMLDYPDEFAFRLGLILTIVPYKDFPEEMRQKIKAYLNSSEQKIRPIHDSWYLCSESERLLLESLSVGATVLVNDALLVKFNGKLTALCLRTFTDNAGMTFVEGNWYSPVSPHTRKMVKEANARGWSKIHIHDGDWVIMRGIADGESGLTGKQILEEARYAMACLDEKQKLGKILGQNRDHYAENHFEDG